MCTHTHLSIKKRQQVVNQKLIKKDRPEDMLKSIYSGLSFLSLF